MPWARLPRPPHERLGFYARSSDWGDIGGGRYREDVAAVPYWFLATVAGLFTAWAACRGVAAGRLRVPGHCPTCGYDLRATPGRCPECGQPAERPAAPAAEPTAVTNQPREAA